MKLVEKPQVTQQTFTCLKNSTIEALEQRVESLFKV